MPDLTDVGISGALHAGVGFFGLLNAASATLPCGWGDHERRGPDRQRFHVLHSLRDGFRSALYTGSHSSQRRATLENPNRTACLLAQALISLFGLFSLTMLTSIYLVLTMSSHSSAPPD